MKNTKLVLIGLVIPVLWLISSTAANAQTNVSIEPEDLTVVGTKLSTVEKRPIFISHDKAMSPTGGAIAIQITPRSLYRTDSLTVFPASAIKIQTSEQQPNGTVFPVEFDLQQTPSSGEFSGKLDLSYQQAGEDSLVTVEIPVTIRVKDSCYLPLFVLLVGIILGFAVSHYRDRTQPRDEVLVRVGRLRTEMQSDSELVKAASFPNQIEAHLYDVKAGLQGDKLEPARIGIDRAEHIWAKWIKGRSDWLNQFAYWEQLKQQLEDLNPNIPYVQTVRRDMEDASREAPSLEGPHQLRNSLNELAGHINLFLQLQALDKQLQNLLEQLPPEDRSNWDAKIQGWARQINRIQPSELNEDKTLLVEMEEAIAQLSQLVAQLSPKSVTAKGILSIPHLAPAPSASPLSWERQISAAGWRLWWFKKVSYLIAIVFLTGTGFSQLYIDNPTFGASPVKDYFALLAWGFGAEASRDAVTKMIQGWGVRGNE